MNHNPYAPPKANVDTGEPAATAVSSARLYSSMQLALAAFIGSPVAAAWFGAANFRALGEPRKARQTILWGSGATVLVMALAFVLPDGTPSSVVPIAYSIGVRALAEQVFGARVKDHTSAGGQLGSWWRVVGISFLFVLGLVVVAFAVGLLLVQLDLVKI